MSWAASHVGLLDGRPQGSGSRVVGVHDRDRGGHDPALQPFDLPAPNESAVYSRSSSNCQGRTGARVEDCGLEYAQGGTEVQHGLSFRSVVSRLQKCSSSQKNSQLRRLVKRWVI